MASRKMCLVAALCSVILFYLFYRPLLSAARSQHQNKKVAHFVFAASCCLRYTKRPLPCRRLLNYSIQTINTSCDIHAIIFHLPGRFVCADPSVNWTRRGMECINERTRKNIQIIKEGTQGNTTST